MSVFVDSSVWFASVVARDRHNARAKSVLKAATDHVTTDHVIVETWLLLNSRYHRQGAERFWDSIRRGPVRVGSGSQRPSRVKGHFRPRSGEKAS